MSLKIGLKREETEAKLNLILTRPLTKWAYRMKYEMCALIIRINRENNRIKRKIELHEVVDFNILFTERKNRQRNKKHDLSYTIYNK